MAIFGPILKASMSKIIRKLFPYNTLKTICGDSKYIFIIALESKYNMISLVHLTCMVLLEICITSRPIHFVILVKPTSK